MLTDYDVAKRIESKLVVHSSKGPGIVRSTEEDHTSVEMILPKMSMPSSKEIASLKYHEKLMLGSLLEIAEDIDSEEVMRTSRFVTDPEWSIAPSERDIVHSEMRIRNSTSNIVVPSSNPPRPVLHKERWVEQHREFLSSRSISFENAVSSHTYQIQNCVDWQLGWFLLRGNEKYPSYMNRIMALQSDLGKRAWSGHILPEVEEESRVHLVKCAATYSAVSMAVRDMDAIQSIRRVSSLIETRIVTLYQEVVGGFTRSYFRDRSRRSHEGERRNELSA